MIVYNLYNNNRLTTLQALVITTHNLNYILCTDILFETVTLPMMSTFSMNARDMKPVNIIAFSKKKTCTGVKMQYLEWNFLNIY